MEMKEQKVDIKTVPAFTNHHTSKVSILFKIERHRLATVTC